MIRADHSLAALKRMVGKSGLSDADFRELARKLLEQTQPFVLTDEEGQELPDAECLDQPGRPIWLTSN